MRTVAVLAAVASFLLVGSGVAAQPRAVTARQCGSVTARTGGNDYSYRIKVFVAPLPCITARTVMRGFIVRGAVPRGWFCRYGHSADRWAATCARAGHTAPVVRAYLIAG